MLNIAHAKFGTHEPIGFGQADAHRLAEAVSTTVARGGDTDTNAAICGALLGAVQGRTAVPLQRRNMVLTCRSVAVPDVHHPRPTTYWTDDALDLAEALLSAGRKRMTSDPK